MLDALVPEVVLDRARVDALVGQGEPTGVPKHVRVDGKLQTRLAPSPLHQLVNRRPRERSATLRGEQERAVGVLPPKSSQGANLVALEVMRGGVAALQAIDMQAAATRPCCPPSCAATA